MVWSYIKESIVRGTVQLVRRPMYVLTIIIVPLLSAWILLDMMSPGSVRRVPVGVVDLDRSALSNQLTRRLRSFQQVNIRKQYANFNEARNAVQRGDVYGFFFIPSDFSERTLSGRQPVVSYYVNYSYFAPASMQYKGFKTISLLANGGIVQTSMRTLGLTDQAIAAKLQPILADSHAIGNPWLNYNYYLSASFVPCLLALMILLTTAFSIGIELKTGLCRQWLATAGDNIGLALLGKLLPQTVLFTVIGWAIQWMMYIAYGLPLNCPPARMLIAMPLFVMANQGLTVTFFCFCPNFRYGTTLCTLFGMLSFSFCAFSLPEEAMYPWVAALGYIMPVKYYYLISVDQALNGIAPYYSRLYYAALIGFILLPLPLKWRLKAECRNPFYIP